MLTLATRVRSRRPVSPPSTCRPSRSAPRANTPPRRASPIWSNYGRPITAISKAASTVSSRSASWSTSESDILPTTSARSAISRPTTATLYSMHRTHVATKHRGGRSSGDKSSRALMWEERNFPAERSATRYRALYPRPTSQPCCRATSRATFARYIVSRAFLCRRASRMASRALP